MDVLYPVRRGDWNEELRFSLRSLSLYSELGRVFLVGHRPHWVSPRATLFPREQSGSKYRNANENLLWAADHAELSDPFLLMNDDFYLLRPLTRVRHFHRGPLGEMIDWYRRMHHTGAYFRNMGATYQLLKSLRFSKPLSYELHVPMAMDKETLFRAWDKGKAIDGLHIRSMVGNLGHYRGTYMEDVKVYRGRPVQWEGWPFLSTNDDLKDNGVGKVLLSLFPGPSPYEQ